MIELERFIQFVNGGYSHYAGYDEMRGRRAYEIRIHPNDFHTLRTQLERTYGNMPHYAHDPYGHERTMNQIMNHNFQLDDSVRIGCINVFFRPPDEVRLGDTGPPKEHPVSMKDVCSSMIKNLTEETDNKTVINAMAITKLPLRRDPR